MTGHGPRTLPEMGLGTSHPNEATETATVVRNALDVGYRHVDAAQLYGNEAAVGAGLDAASVDRSEVFLASKVEPGNLSPADVRTTTAASLDRLDVESLDLLYVHWPTEAYDPAATLAAFDDLVDRGDVRYVGVSNFNPDQLRQATTLLDAPLFAHQVECHPLLPQPKLRACASEMDHHLVAHSPLAGGAALDHPTVRAVAADHDASPAQVCLAWLRSKDVFPVPKATSRGHLADNHDAPAVDLDADAVDRIDDVHDRVRTVNFDGAPWDRT